MKQIAQTMYIRSVRAALGAAVIGFCVAATPAIAEPPVTDEAQPRKQSGAQRTDKLPVYTPQKLSSESLTSVGSDSMDGLVRLWVEEYKKFQPELKLQVVSRGSATAPAALIEGSADLGPMARPMKSDERETFISTYGFEPTQVRTAIAAVAIYVPKSNPISQISFAELTRIFADQTAPEAQSGTAALSWSALGTKLPNADQIVPLGLHPDTNLGAYFKQHVLLQRPFNEELLGTADNSSLFKALEMNPGGIGFGVPVTASAATGLKVLAVRKDSSSKAIFPSEAQIVKGAYPLSRYLSIYVVREPGKGVDPALHDFLRFVLSEQGQKLVAAQGLTPLPVAVVREELAKLE